MAIIEQLTRRRLPEGSILIESSKGVNDIASLNNKISLECNEAKTYLLVMIILRFRRLSIFRVKKLNK